jgi:hypothetical protein
VCLCRTFSLNFVDSRQLNFFPFFFLFLFCILTLKFWLFRWGQGRYFCILHLSH